MHSAHRLWLIPFISLLAAGTLQASAWAQSSTKAVPDSFLVGGVASVPEYEGSADRTAVPLLLGRIEFGDRGSLRIAGTTLRYNVLPSTSRWALGPVLGFRAARDEDIKNIAVARLRKIDATAEGGAFVEYALTDLMDSGDRLSVGLDVRGGEGVLWTLSTGYNLAAIGPWRLGVDASLSGGNTRRMTTYFSVDADNSARSGLAQYDAGSGLQQMGLGLNVSRAFAGNWLVAARFSGTRLAGNAADSPIVTRGGRRTSALFGIGIGKSF